MTNKDLSIPREQGSLFPEEVMAETVDYSTETTKQVLEEKGLTSEEQIRVENPFTGKITTLTINREGTHDEKLMLALADPNMTRDQKDHTISMYLYERGKDSASMMVDLMRYKGAHSKETRAFKSQMRFDFEMFVSLFTGHLTATAKDIGEALGFSNLNEIVSGYITNLKQEKPLSLKDWLTAAHNKTLSDEGLALLSIAIRNKTEADRLNESVKKTAEVRMKEKGFGIYIDSTGKPFTIFDKELSDVVQKDINRLNELKDEGVI